MLVIFEGGPAPSFPEQMLRDVREAIVIELIEKARGSGLFQSVIVCTDRPGLARAAACAGAEVELDEEGGPFHFGRRLQRLIRDRRLDAVCCMGGAAAPLATRDDLEVIAQAFESRQPFVAANNIHSADIVAFAPARAVLAIDPPAIDNALPLALHRQCGLPLVRLARTLGLQFDVDSPSDIMVLAVHPGTGPRVRDALRKFDLDASRYEAAKRALANPGADVFLYGRIGAPLFSYLDEYSRCRIRLVSEERGMKALGRDERGEVRSVLGYALEALGMRGFVQCLESLCRAAFLDTRVLLAHARRQVPTADRFYSDLGLPERVGDPWLRELTAAAAGAAVPVLLGGHGLVTGGVWALLDAALREAKDRPPGGAAAVTPSVSGRR